MNTVLISSWKCNFSIYLNIQVYYLYIQAITTLLCLILVLYVLVPSIHSFFYLATLSWKVTFSGTQKPTPPTVFNLQASDWVHCEEETGVYYQLSRFTYKFVKKKKKLKLLILPQKIFEFKKNHKIYYSYFFSKRDNWAYLYIY